MTSGHVEEVAIRRAVDTCRGFGIAAHEFVIYSDNDEAIRTVSLPNVVRVDPEIKRKGLHLADVVLDRIMSRCSYLRGTEAIVKARKPPTPRQEEIERLVKAKHMEFHLSSSPLYLSMTIKLVEGLPVGSSS